MPLYEFGVTRSYQWYGAAVGQYGGHWEVRGSIQRERKTLLSLEVDEPLTLFVDELTNRLRELELVDLDIGPIGEDGIPTLDCVRRGQGPFDVDGTLLLAIRSVCSIDGVTDWDNYNGGRFADRHQGVILTGGLAFIEGIKVGTDLEGQDPTRVIEQTCLMLAGKDFDRNTPNLEAWRIRIEDNRRAKKEKRERILAKARAILTQHLSEEQLVQFEATGEFTVIGGDGYQYLITDKHHHNVFRIEDGKQTHMYCIVSEDLVPDHDQMLAQMLLLQANPEMFHKITNTWVMGENETWKFVRQGPEMAVQDLDG
jgi:hypothetical protein